MCQEGPKVAAHLKKRQNKKIVKETLDKRKQQRWGYRLEAAGGVQGGLDLASSSPASPGDAEMRSSWGRQGPYLDLCAWLQGPKLANIGKTYKNVKKTVEKR